MRKRNKILLGIISAITIIITTLIIVVAMNAGTLVKKAILKYGPEYTGRKIELENSEVNIFNAKAELKKFKIYEKDGENLFFSIDTFNIDLNLLELFNKKIVIEGLGLENPRLTIKKNGEIYNFVDIIETINSKNKVSQRKNQMLSLIIYS